MYDATENVTSIAKLCDENEISISITRAWPPEVTWRSSIQKPIFLLQTPIIVIVIYIIRSIQKF